jgi:hypothetical protein
MTTAQPDRLDQLESVIERIDRKLDAIANDIRPLTQNSDRSRERDLHSRCSSCRGSTLAILNEYYYSFRMNESYTIHWSGTEV